MYTTMYSPRWG